MAYARQSVISTQSPISCDDSLIDAIRSFFEKRRASFKLQAMSDRELSDIGICRSEINRAVSGDLNR